MRIILLIFHGMSIALLAAMANGASLDADMASGALQQFNSHLYRLYEKYPNYHKQLANYANIQGFSLPVENLATIVHEIIHIDSFTHKAYWFDGTYIEPYLISPAWPTITNQLLAPYITTADRRALGPIYPAYFTNTPNNTLANIIDEINAYAHTVPFICDNAPAQAPRHLQALAGHLALADIYLRTVAQTNPAQYQHLTQNLIARGALETIIANAYKTLNHCHQLGIPEADPRLVPKHYTQAFASQPKP